MSMSIITRQIGESLIIGEDITITMLNIKDNNQARLGVDVPKDMPVYRQEVYQHIKKEKLKEGQEL